MSEQELRERAGDPLVKRVFGDPVERDGVTIVPVVRLREGRPVRPAGAYVVREGEVTWQPAVDVNAIVLGGQVVGGLLALVALLLLRRRRPLG